jgi:hypothetical protein
MAAEALRDVYGAMETNDDAVSAEDEHGGHRFVDAVAGR